jgi:hypothetical protein
MQNIHAEAAAATAPYAVNLSAGDAHSDKFASKDESSRIAEAAGDKLRADAIGKCVTIDGDTIKGGCSPNDHLPPLTFERPGSLQSNDLRLNYDSIPSHKFPESHDYKTGDSTKFVGAEQQLSLADGQRISVGPKGQIQIFDSTGKEVTVISRDPAAADIMPQVDRTVMSNGARVSQSANITMINFPDGTSVGLDQNGLRAIDRPGASRLQLQPSLGDFDFRGYK